MPVIRCSNGKYRIGSGDCIYDSKSKAVRAYRGYLASKHAKKAIGGNMIETKLNFFVPINKVDEEQRMVYGIATTSELDKQNEIVDWKATKEALEDYSNWRNIREMHKPSAVGTAPIIEARDNTQEVYIGAKIVDDSAWEKCKQGVYKGFSIGGEVLDRKIEMNKTTNRPCNRVTKYLLNEISVVDRPANPKCKFQTVKRDTSIEVVTVSEDPLLAESQRIMQKAVLIAQRSLKKSELEALPDTSFGLIKFVTDGDKLIKHRLYPMPDKTHAINMVRKMTGCDDLSAQEKEQIHTTAMSVLGKKHVEGECPYCIKTKLEGGVSVEKEVKKEVAGTTPAEPIAKTEGTAVAPAKPEEKKPVAPSTTPAEQQKPTVKVDEEAPTAGGADAVNPMDALSGKIDQLIALFREFIGEEAQEPEHQKTDDAMPAKGCEEDEGLDAKPAGEEEVDVDEAVAPAEAGAKPAEETSKTPEAVAQEQAAEEENEAAKGAKTGTLAKGTAPAVKKVTAIAKEGIVKELTKQVKSIVEPMAKELKDVKARLEKYEKAPLPRKGAAPAADGKVKVEKFAQQKTGEVPQGRPGEMVIQKREATYSPELQKDITKANDLRKCGKALTKDEEAFCQRVAEQMLAAKMEK